MIRPILTVAILIFYGIRWRPSVLKRIFENKVSIYLFVGEILMLIIAIFQLTDNDPFKFDPPLFMNYISLAVALMGAVFASIARLALRENYVPAMAAFPPKKMVTTGLYRIIRHPAYFGTLIALIGFELALSSYLVIIALAFAVIIIAQIIKEEKMLSELYGAEWQDYVRQVPYKLILFIY